MEVFVPYSGLDATRSCSRSLHFRSEYHYISRRGTQEGSAGADSKFKHRTPPSIRECSERCRCEGPRRRDGVERDVDAELRGGSAV